MANVINSLVQTDAKDFESKVQAYFEYAQNQFQEIWTDFNEDQFMVLIAELIAYEGDLLTYYLDKQTSENFLTSATLRQSVIDIGIMLDYRLASAVPATGAVTFTLNPTTFDYLTPIPEGFRIGNGVLTFETTEETLVPLGALSVTINAIEGETRRETVLGDGAVGQSDGTPSQRFTLEERNIVLSNTVSALASDLPVLVGNDPYSPVFGIVTAQSTDRVFTIETNEDDETDIIFGNGIHGVIPPSSVDIEATYRFLLDERLDNNFGKVNANAIQTLIDTRTGIEAVTNAAAFTGGRDKETIEEAKINIPRSVSAGDRAVSDTDYVTLAEGFTGVAKAAALKAADVLNVDLYVAPDGGGSPAQQLKNDLIVFFDTRKMMRTKVFVRDPIYQPVSLNLRVQAEPNNRNSDIEAAVRTALNNLFSFDNMRFDQGVFFKTTGGSDLFDLNETIEGVNGIARIKYNEVTLKPIIYGKKFTNSGTPEIIGNGSTIFSNSSRKELEVEMKTTTNFLLKNKEFGISTSLNDTRLEDNLKTFLLDSGESTLVGVASLTDESQFWQVDQYANQTLIDSAGAQFEILSNDNISLTLDTVGTPAAGTYQIVRRLVGQYLNPNIDQSLTFPIISNDANSVSVSLGLSEVANIGDSYEIFRYETNIFHADSHAGTNTDAAATSTTFADTGNVVNPDDFYNGFYVVFQDGPAANIPVQVIDYVQATGAFVTQSFGIGIVPQVGDRYVVFRSYEMGLKTNVSSTPSPTTTTFTGDSLGTEGDDFYNGATVYFTTGALAGTSRRVLDYDDAGADLITVNDLGSAPVAGDEFQLAREYKLDDCSMTFGLVSNNSGITDLYLIQISDKVGDLTPRANQILEISDEDDIVITVVGGS